MTQNDVVEQYSRLSGKWILYLCLQTPESTNEDIIDALPFLSDSEAKLLLTEGCIFVSFNNRVSEYSCFEQIEMGPNFVNGPCRIYAYICEPDRGITDEN